MVSCIRHGFPEPFGRFADEPQGKNENFCYPLTYLRGGASLGFPGQFRLLGRCC